MLADLDFGGAGRRAGTPAGAGEPQARRVRWTAWQRQGHQRSDGYRGRRRAGSCGPRRTCRTTTRDRSHPYEVGQFVHDNLELYFEVHGSGPAGPDLPPRHPHGRQHEPAPGLGPGRQGQPGHPPRPARATDCRPVRSGPPTTGWTPTPGTSSPSWTTWASTRPWSAGCPRRERQPPRRGPGARSGPRPGDRDAGARVGAAGRRHHLRAACCSPSTSPGRSSDGWPSVFRCAAPHRQRPPGQRHEHALGRAPRDGRRPARDPGRADRPDSGPAGGHGHPGPGDRAQGGPRPPVPRRRAAGPPTPPGTAHPGQLGPRAAGPPRAADRGDQPAARHGVGRAGAAHVGGSG